MSGTSRPGPLAVLGGTFNPVHYGHLRSAIELVEHLGFSELRLMPCALPPHRETPACSAEHRAAMVELAVAGDARLSCDRRELNRNGPSYTVDSLQELRNECGEAVSLCLVMGCDAFLAIRSWKDWQRLLELAHIVVIGRPGWQLPADGPVADWLAIHRASSARVLAETPAGSIHIEELRPLAISSTEIRSLLQSGNSVRYLLPESVIDYIESFKLYT
ncbi:MAG: nicotinate-nucleotide adenylyltransferase [Halieaceae bacterium]